MSHTSVRLTHILDTYTFTELRHHLAAQHITLPVCLADPQTDLALFFQTTCYDLKIPGSLGTIYNLAWTHRFFSTLKADCLVIDQSILTAFTSYLTSKQKNVAVTHLISIGNNPAETTVSPNDSIQYIHHHHLKMPHVS